MGECPDYIFNPYLRLTLIEQYFIAEKLTAIELFHLSSLTLALFLFCKTPPSLNK